MSERQPNVRCMSTWCRYWIRVFDEALGEKMGGCNAWTLMVATKSGDSRPTCVPYIVSDDPQKAGIHSSPTTAKRPFKPDRSTQSAVTEEFKKEVE